MIHEYLGSRSERDNGSSCENRSCCYNHYCITGSRRERDSSSNGENRSCCYNHSCITGSWHNVTAAAIEKTEAVATSTGVPEDVGQNVTTVAAAETEAMATSTPVSQEVEQNVTAAAIEKTEAVAATTGVSEAPVEPPMAPIRPIKLPYSTTEIFREIKLILRFKPDPANFAVSFKSGKEHVFDLKMDYAKQEWRMITYTNKDRGILEKREKIVPVIKPDEIRQISLELLEDKIRMTDVIDGHEKQHHEVNRPVAGEGPIQVKVDGDVYLYQYFFSHM
uniref:Uncharacterized protein n=1 Tax=Trichuris muris TaxID=70415 RepID=A0A5S6R282_TRIMR